MKKILECVPNFSEGQSKIVINAIADEVRNTAGVQLLDVDSGFHANRTVYTIAGEPFAVCDAAFNMIKAAQNLIDMRLHKGEHPRIGAMDVCPLIPISGISMTETVELSKILGQRIASELDIPVYLYENSACDTKRQNLAWLRKGEYEGLQNKLMKQDFYPDYGTNVFKEKSGIAIVGARNFLIAFNVNLDTKDIKVAQKIAEEIRESGKNNISGTLKNVKAIAWYIKEFDTIQISMNLTNYLITPIWQVFEEISTNAVLKGVNVTGSELVGMIPLKAITDVGCYVAAKNKFNIHTLSQTEIISTAIKYLRLDNIKPFDYTKKIIEIALDNNKY